MSDRAAWDKMAEDEANALATMLANDRRSVMVIVIAADSDDLGTTLLVHGVAGKTTGASLRQFIAGAERKLTWLRDKLYRRA